MFHNRGRLRRRFARFGAHQQKVGFMPTSVPTVIASRKSEIPNHCNQRLPHLPKVGFILTALVRPRVPKYTLAGCRALAVGAKRISRFPPPLGSRKLNLRRPRAPANPGEFAGAPARGRGLQGPGCGAARCRASAAAAVPHERRAAAPSPSKRPAASLCARAGVAGSRAGD